MNRLKILVVDDHALVREGLCQVLKGLNESVEVLEAQHCTRAFEVTAQHPDLDLVLLDYDLPGMNGLDALKVFGQAHPELPILMLSGRANPQMVHKALANGAAGFLSKDGHSSDLLAAIDQVLAGDVYVQLDLLAPGALPDLAGVHPHKTAPQFTPRQAEVLSLLLHGRSNKEISDALELADDTTKNHVTALLRAFDVKNRTQLVLAASRQGYIPSAPST